MSAPESVALDSPNDDNAHEIRVLLAKHGIAADDVEKARSAARGRAIYLLVDAPVIFKTATGDQFDRAFGKPEKERPKALRELASFLVVHPEPESYKRLGEELPLLYVTIVDAASSVASGKATTEAKKL
jgi:hypothetical protein